MKITVFSRKAKTHDGRAFNVFVSSLTKNDGLKKFKRLLTLQMTYGIV